jgi:murein DD-endopeptidase MepM/ murein hydrolase activator NlpD
MGAAKEPLRKVVDLCVGEQLEVELSNGEFVPIQLLEITETRDSLREGVTSSQARVLVRGEELWLPCANYHLPTRVAGLQIDCPITKAYYRNSASDAWALEKDARLRLWPGDSPWRSPGTVVYPLAQRWFAGNTQMPNEPVFVNLEPALSSERIYYHYGMDLGGVEGREVVRAATGGIVLTKGIEAARDLSEYGYHPTYDSVHILDECGWIHGYYHLTSIAEELKVAETVAPGTVLGRLGKEGGSGGWAHLHYEIRALQPSGRLGYEDGYAYLWEAYATEHDPPVVAIARPHHLLQAGETTMLDGARSYGKTGPLTYEWILSDGTRASGARLEHTYNKRGTYSEILKVTNGLGNAAYDLTVVEVADQNAGGMPVGLHAAYTPSLGLRAGDEVTFAARLFNTDEPELSWDFGDGSPIVQTKCAPLSPHAGNPHDPKGYALTTHRYQAAGRYLVCVDYLAHKHETSATARLFMEVGATG